MPFLGAEMAQVAPVEAGGAGGLRVRHSWFSGASMVLSRSRTQAQSGRSRPATSRYIGPSIFSAALSTMVGLTVYSPRTRFRTCPVAGLFVIRAAGVNENRPMLRYLRVEELAALSRARRSAYCARGSLQLEGVHDPTMPRLWRQQPCPCQTSV